MNRQIRKIFRPALAGLLAVSAALFAATPVHAQVDLTSSMTGPANYTPGSTGSYQIVVQNVGDATETELDVSTNFPAAVTLDNVTCTDVGTGTTCSTNTSGNDLSVAGLDIAAGGRVTFDLDVTYGSAMSADPLVITATISGSVSVPNRSVSSNRSLESDLSVSKSSAAMDYTPGSTGSYTVVVTNGGPSDSSGVVLADSAPAGMTIGTWACAPAAACPNNNGSGNISETLALDAGQTATYTINVSFDSDALSDPITNTASLSVPASLNDPDTGDQSDSVDLPRNPQADLSVAFPATGLPTSYVPGSTGVSISYDVSNAGPTDSMDATLPLFWSTAASAVTWSCSPAAACDPSSGTLADTSTSVDLASGASVTISATLDFDSGARNDIAITPLISANNETDPTAGNNSDTLNLTVERRADIQVVKTASAAVVNPNDSFTYQIEITNLGPSDIGPDPLGGATSSGELGILLTDDFDDVKLSGGAGCANPQDPCWEACTDDGGVVGDYDPTNCPTPALTLGGDIADLPFVLKAGSSSTVVAFVRSGDAGSVTNLASVRLDDSTANPVVANTSGGGTDADSVVVLIDESTDLSISNDDGATAAVSGEEHSYTLVIQNTGFVSADGVVVNDMLPVFDEAAFLLDPTTISAGFEADSVTWQCSAFDGACCNANSSNCGIGTPTMELDVADPANFSNAVDLPGLSRVEITLTGTLDPRASGTLNNVASLDLPPTLNDPLPANNSDTDSDTVLVRQANLTVDKALVATSGSAAPFSFTYTIEVANDGPSYGADVLIEDPLDNSNLDTATASWCQRGLNDPPVVPCTGAAVTGTGALSATLDLATDAGVAFDVTVDTTATPSGEVSNTASATNENNVTVSDSVSTSLTGEADLLVEKRVVGGGPVAPGDPVDYVITVTNQGPDDVFRATVEDLFPLSIDGLTWSCQATTPVPGDIEPSQLPLPVDTGGNAVIVTGDGRHVYVAGEASDSLFAYVRNATPGAGFGQVELFETEINGIDDGGDAGAAVSGMNGPFDLVLGPQGRVIYVLSNDAVDGPSLAAFARVTDPASPQFGELTFLGAVAADLPLVPTGLAVTQGHVYVAGLGDPAADPPNTAPLITIFQRDLVSSLPVFDSARLADVPSNVRDLLTDASGDYLFAGGDVLQMYTIDEALPGIPAGRLTPVSSLTSGDALFGMTLAPDLPQLVARSTSAGAGGLVVVDYLDMDDAPLLDEVFAFDSGDMTLPMGVSDPLLGAGAISIAPDGEHLSGVSADQSALFTFRRDSGSGDLSFQEIDVVDQPSTGVNRGLREATDVVHAPDGRHLLVAAAADDPTAMPPATNPPLAVYSRRAPDPLFAFIEQDRNTDTGISGLQAPNDVAVVDDVHIYAVSLPDNSLVRFDRSALLGLDDGSLGLHAQFVERYEDGVNGVSGLVQPRRVLVSPDGESVFVTSEQENTIAVFQRQGNSDLPGYGGLTFIEVIEDGVGGVDGISGAQGMAMDPTSTHLYVAGSFESSIARFRRESDGSLTWLDRVVSGTDGVVGLAGVRDLAMAPLGEQLMAVSTTGNALVVFDRDLAIGAGNGALEFVQSVQGGIGDRPMSVEIPGGSGPHAGKHVYVVSQNSNSLAVLRRVLNSNSSAFGQVQPIQFIESGVDDGPAFMDGPRDVRVSPDGKRIYVAAEFSNSVVVFDRDLNTFSPRYGFASAVETRRDGVNGVDGLRQVRAVTITRDSKWVYSVGFGDGALSSFRLGTGSLCTAGGSGVISDIVDIGANGTIEYRASGIVRPDAAGVLSNTATVRLPETFTAPMGSTLVEMCDDGELRCFSGTVDVDLVPEGSLTIDKTSDQVSVVAGDTAVYEVVIQNAGPSSLEHVPGMGMDPGFPLTVSDLLDSNPAFVPGSAVWSCEAIGSGSLGFLDAQRTVDPDDPTSGPFEGLEGVARMAFVPGSPGPWLVSTSVLDDSISVFTRDPVTGELLDQLRVANGDMLGMDLIGSLAGAQAVVASADGQYLYVASRVADTVTVFSIADDGMGAPVLALEQVVTPQIGLNQAVDLVLDDAAGQPTLYVAGANDDAIAVFSRHPSDGTLTAMTPAQQGINGADGLQDVSSLWVRDGHLYALSPTSGSIALFDRDPGNGELTWRATYDGMDFGVDLDGASDLVIDGAGRDVYVAAALSNRIVVLERDTSGGATAGELAFRSSIEQGDGGANGLVGVGQLAITEDGVHVYATSSISSSVAWFLRDDADGSLSYGGLRGNEGNEVTGLGGATGLAVDRAPDTTLDQVFVAGSAQGAIARFQRTSDSFCPASGTGELDAVPFNIGAGGTVTFTIEVEVAAGTTGEVVNVATLIAARDPDNPTQDATESNVVSTTADLSITKDDGLRELDGLAGARAVTGTNVNVYTAAPTDNAIGVFARNRDAGGPTDGELEFLQVLRSGEGGVEGVNGVRDLQISADGAHVYAASPVDNAVTTFERSGDDGTLAFSATLQNGIAGVSGISGARALALSADDAHVYAVGEFSNSVAVFGRQFDDALPDFGQLTFLEFEQNGVGGVSGIGTPVALAVSTDGRHVYVAGAENDTLAVFERNRVAASASFGLLDYVAHYTQNVDGVVGLEGIRDVVVSADGDFVYALGQATGTIARFRRDPATGELTFQDFKQDGTSGTTGLTGARQMELDDSGASLFVAGAAAEAVVRFDVTDDADPMVDGTLDFGGILANGDAAPLTGGTVFGLEGASGLFLTPDGRHVYTAAAGRGAVVALLQNMSPTGIDFQQILIDGLGGVAPGTEVVYLITVENLGPSSVPQAQVIDNFPDGFESVTWECIPEGGTGAGCLPGQVTGDVDLIVSLPVGGRATIRAAGTISAGASGRLVNTATINALGVQDPNLSNNSATDDDTVLSPASDLVVTVDNGVDEVVPGDVVGYDVVVANNGPSSVRGVFVEDVFPPAMFDTTWSCVASPSPGVLAAPLESDTQVAPSAVAISDDGRWAYVAAGNAIEAFRRDPLTGQIGIVPPPPSPPTPPPPPIGVVEAVYSQGVDGITGIQGAADVVLAGGGRFLFVAGAASDAVALFERDTATGELEFTAAWQDGLAGVEGIGGVNRLRVSPDGNWLYAAGADDNAIAIFSISPVDGALSPAGVLAQGVDGIDGLNGITDMAFAEDASLLLVTADANQSLTTFARNATTGALTLNGVLFNDDLLGGPGEDGLLGAVSLIEAGDELLVASTSGNRITRFELRTEVVDDVDVRLPKALGVIDSAALDGETLTAPGRMAFDPDRARLYVIGFNELVLLNLFGDDPALVERYAVDDHPVLSGISSLALGPAFRHLHTFGTQATAEIGSWARERGSRCPLSGTGDLGRQQVDIVAGGSLVYRLDGRVRANATGTLDYTVSVENPDPTQELNPPDNTATDSDPLGPAPDLEVSKTLETDPIVAGLPVDWTIAMGNLGLSDAPGSLITDEPPVFPAPNGILAGSGSWSCEANEPLSASTAFPTPESISSFALSPEGDWLYATSAAGDALLAFPIDGSGTPGVPIVIRDGDVFPQDGSAPDLEVEGLDGASAVTAASGGLHVYATGATGNSVLVFGRDEVGEPLEYRQTLTTETPATSTSVPGLRGARAVALSPDERFVFVAGADSNAIAVFERDEEGGQLTFIERVADGIGTIVPEFDVIRDVADLHPSSLGTDLYAVATFSEAFSRFSINEESGVLTFEQVVRAGGPVPAMPNLRDLAVAPGDTHLYGLTDAGIAIFSRQTDGSLIFDEMFAPVASLADAVGLVVDRSGSRAYVLADDGTGAPVIHVIRRDWSDGSLELWFTQPIAATGPVVLIQNPATGQVILGGDDSDLLRFDELALSRCAQTEGASDALITTVDLGVGGQSDFDFSATVHPSARGSLDNTVTVAPGIGTDPFLDNNTATVSGPITVVSDIGVTKTGPATAVAGTTIDYLITVTNAGPSDALGIEVTDLAPAELIDFAWTCTPSAGSSCPASGTTVPDFTADVLVGGQLDIVLSATIDPAFIGQLINVVLLTPEAGATDPTPDDQRAEWITTVRAEADVSVIKEMLTDPVVAGENVVYRIIVASAGPSLATSVSVEDFAPAALSNLTWTCTGAGTAVCPASGTGAPAFTLEMPPGSSIELLLEGALSPDATGNLTNTARALVGSPATDPVAANNTAVVTDPITVVPDVALDLDDPLDPFDPAGPVGMPYLATLTNAGPSTARGLVLELTTSAPITPQSPGCVNPTPTLIRCLTGPLAPGEVKVFELTLFDLPAAPATLIIDGIASTSGDDPDLANNVDSTSTELVNGSDLDVRLTNDRNFLSPDEDTTYTLTINNIGSVDAPLADVELLVPVELLDPQWTCAASAGASCQASGSGDVIDAASVASGATVTYTLEATVDPLLDLTIPQSVVMSGLAQTSPPGNDINPVNNLAADVDEVRLVMFADGFESPVRTQEVVQRLDGSCSEIVLGHPGKASGVILEGRAYGGQRLFWIEASLRGDRTWLQAVSMGERAPQLSGWLEWPTGETSIRIDRRDLRVDLPGSLDWRPGSELPASVDRIVLPARRSVDGRGAALTVDACSPGVAQ